MHHSSDMSLKNSTQVLDLNDSTIDRNGEDNDSDEGGFMELRDLKPKIYSFQKPQEFEA